jgi:flagellar assembly factor FliW
MSTVKVHNTELSYEPSDIITFNEGLIGLPGLRRMVLVRQSGMEPFLWLASLDVQGMAFLVVEPHSLFPRYSALNAEVGEQPLLLALVKLENEWTKTTVNLRAPLVVNPMTRRGLQIVLSDSNYSLAERLPSQLLAA